MARTTESWNEQRKANKESRSRISCLWMQFWKWMWQHNQIELDSHHPKRGRDGVRGNRKLVFCASANERKLQHECQFFEWHLKWEHKWKWKKKIFNTRLGEARSGVEIGIFFGKEKIQNTNTDSVSVTFEFEKLHSCWTKKLEYLSCHPLPRPLSLNKKLNY